MGSSSAYSEWIVPVATFVEAQTNLVIMNTGTEAANVEWEALDESEFVDLDSIVVEPETIAIVPVEVGVGVYGVSVTADRPVSVGWSVAGDQGVALVAGIALR